MSPMDGSTLIYKKLVLPVFREKQGSIDSLLNKGREKFDYVAGDISDKGIDSSYLLNKLWQRTLFCRRDQVVNYETLFLFS